VPGDVGVTLQGGHDKAALIALLYLQYRSITRRFRKATYPMSIEDKDELAQEFAEFGYRETSDPTDADRRNFYKVEKWDAAELHVEALIHASNDLECARAIFASEKNRRPRGRYTLRQGLRVLERWPPR